MTKYNPFRYFKTSPDVIRLAVMMYVRFPLSLRNVEDLLHERGIDISHETVRFWWNRFGPMFAVEIRDSRASRMRAYSNWRWHLDEVFVKINGETHYLWRAVDHECEVLESYVTKRRDRKAALKFLRKSMKRYGNPEVIVTDKLRSYGAAMKVIGNVPRQQTGRRTEATNTEAFCISCHEMEDNVFAELKETVHYTNNSGVRASCPDCHVPHNWSSKIARKMAASKEVYGKIFGTINTPEKFEAHRLTMAQHEWARMEANDSLECRNCHAAESMDITLQSTRAAEAHERFLFTGEKTCISCHRGIAHRLPEETARRGHSGDGNEIALFLKAFEDD